MKRTTVVIAISTGLVLLLSLGAYALYSGIEEDRRSSLRGLYTHDSFINGLYHDLNLNNPHEVFRYVFANLEDEVTVYPSENYYYFEFTAIGYTVSGSLLFSASKAEQGKMGLGYTVKPEHRTQHNIRNRGGHHEFTERDSVYVRRIDDFHYTVTYGGRTVDFRFYDGGVTPPRRARLSRNEEYVGPSFDESGLRFYLLFNKRTNKLYWILNEDEFVPEQFTRYSDNVVIGDRTEFAFFPDTANNRKILVGVSGDNVLHNNWFDGPFDQMPDNHVKAGRIDVQSYLNTHYGLQGGEIDRFGKFTQKEGARVPVALYTVYYDKKDLDFVDSIRALNLQQDEFYTQITRQVYNLAPKNTVPNNPASNSDRADSAAKK